MRARPIAVPAVAAVLEPVGAPVAEPPAALPVQTVVVRELRAVVLAVTSLAAPAADQGLVLLQVAALQADPVMVQALPVDREVVSLVPGLDPAAARALIRVAAPALAPVVVQAPPVDREVAPVVSLAGLPAARRVVPADRAEARLEVRVAAVALQRVRAVARATVKADAARVAGPGAADPVVVRVAGQAGVGRRLDQPAAPGPALTARAI
jgi:hypothetical protein